MGNPLQSYQHAYRAGWSTETVLYQWADAAPDTIETEEIALCALLDTKGAFDNTSYTNIRDALIHK